MKSIWYIYHSTRGSAGAYMHRLLLASQEAGLKSIAFVSTQYKFDSPGAIRFFFPFTENTEKRNLLINIIRALEYTVNLGFIWLGASLLRPIIHLQLTESTLPTYIFFRLCRLTRLKIVTTCHDVIEHSGEVPYRRKNILINSHLLVVHNHNAESVLTGLLPETRNRIFIYPFPFADAKPILTEAGMTSAEQKLKVLTDGRKWLLFTGYVRESKGIALLYEAWKRGGFSEDTALMIAGKWQAGLQDLKEELKDCRNTFILDRRLTDEELHYCISNSFFVVYPYLNYSHSGIFYSCVYSGGVPLLSDIELFGEMAPEYPFTFRSGDIADLVLSLHKCLRTTVEERDEARNYLLKRIEKGMGTIPFRLEEMKKYLKFN